jgi:hypothetical protein
VIEKGMRLPVLRFFLYWFVIAVTFLVIIFFAGTGYSLLLFAALHLATVVAFYWDRAAIVIVGRERHRAMAHRIVKMRESLGLKILSAFVGAIWFASAIWVIFAANSRLIDLF